MYYIQLRNHLYNRPYMRVLSGDGPFLNIDTQCIGSLRAIILVKH